MGQDRLSDLIHLIEDQSDAWADLDEPGVRFIVKPCRTDNGDLSPHVEQYQGGNAIISATASHVVYSRGFERLYLLTDGHEVIQKRAPSPSFTVDPDRD